MQTLYFFLAALHMVAVVVTGILWTLLDLGHGPKLRPHLRDIRAVHFGSLYLVPWFLGLAYAFDKLAVPALHQVAFPDWGFYYWTRGWPMVLSLIGLACLVTTLLWTATVLVIYSLSG